MSVDQEAAENTSNYLLSLSKVIIYFLLFKKKTTIISEDKGYFLPVIITCWFIYSDNQKYYTVEFFSTW